MIYSLKARDADYEQVSEIFVIAKNEEEAIKLAEEEVRIADSYLTNPIDQKFELKQIDLSKPAVLSVLLK